MSVRISEGVSTKNRASIAALRSFAQPIVKSWQYNVVLVQDMHPVTSCLLNASIPSIRQTSILGSGVERHPSRAHPVSDFGSGMIG
jgi:hypothetical protein